MTLDAETLATLARLEAEATPGPWSNWEDDEGAYFVHRDSGQQVSQESDAALIAAMRNHLPALLEAVERLARLECRIREFASAWEPDLSPILGARDALHELRDTLEPGPCPHETELAAEQQRVDDAREILRTWLQEEDLVQAQAIRDALDKYTYRVPGGWDAISPMEIHALLPEHASPDTYARSAEGRLAAQSEDIKALLTMVHEGTISTDECVRRIDNIFHPGTHDV